MSGAGPRVAPPSQRRAGRASDLFPVGDWFRHHALRSFPVLLFVALTCVPPIALVILDANLSAATFTAAAWIFAAYFALAWLLVLGIIVRPNYVTRPMLGVVVAVALVTQVPLAIALESALHSSDTTFGLSIATVGIPEEFVKAVPVLVIALLYRGRMLMARDYMFLGAVSGLAFGASEVVHYFTTNSVVGFYRTVQGAVPSISHLIAAGHPASASVFDVLIGPVWYFIITFVWRFLTDPITHACWAGITGYFVGLAVTRRHTYWVALIGLAVAAVLHGLNDWSRVNGHPVWIFVVVASSLVFLGYARVGARIDEQFAAVAPPFLSAHYTAVVQAPASADGEPAVTPARPSHAAPAEHRPAEHRPAGTHARSQGETPWWWP